MTEDADREELTQLVSSLATTRGWEEAPNASWFVGGWRVGVAPTGPPRLIAFRDGQMREFQSLGELRAFVEPGAPPTREVAGPPLMASAAQTAAVATRAEAPMAIAARLIGVSAIIGAALGLATMLFLILTGFFDASDSLEDFGNAIVGGALLIGVVVFALLVGIVMASIDGIVAARLAANPSDARIAGAVAGAVGHLALVLALGAILTLGFLIFARDDDSPEASPVPSMDPAECLQLFGPDSELCNPEQEDEDDSSSVPWDDIIKAMAGVIPAGLAGGGAAAMMYRRP